MSTEENYSNTSPNLVSSRQLAGPGLPRSRFDLIPDLASRGVDIQSSSDGAIELELLVTRMNASGDAVDMFVFHELRTMITPTVQLAATTEETFKDLLRIPLESDGQVLSIGKIVSDVFARYGSAR